MRRVTTCCGTPASSVLAPSSRRSATDAENLFITLSGRALRPDLFIVARAREESSAEKLTRAGANRVVNPQEIGGARIAAFLLQPHVTEFLDVVMHDRTIELRLEEITVPPGSALAGQHAAASPCPRPDGCAHPGRARGDGTFLTNPDPDTELVAGQILIAIGTDDQLRALSAAAGAGESGAEEPTSASPSRSAPAGPSPTPMG